MIWDWNYFLHQVGEVGFLGAALTTIWVAVVAEVGGVALGFVLAIASLARARPLHWFSAVYIWIWRGSPLLVQLLLLYFGLPQLGVRLGVLAAGLLGLVLNEAAYMAVIVASSLRAVDPGQRDAARALGFRAAQSLRQVELPQAARSIVPALGNQFNSMMKTTALLTVISFSELLSFTRDEIATNYRPLEAFAIASLYYLLMSTVWGVVQAQIEQRLGRGFTSGPTGGGLIARLLSLSPTRMM